MTQGLATARLPGDSGREVHMLAEEIIAFFDHLARVQPLRTRIGTSGDSARRANASCASIAHCSAFCALWNASMAEG